MEKGMVNEQPKQVNFNTILLFVITLMLPIIGFFSKHELARLEESIRDLQAVAVPRKEFDAEALNARENYNRVQVDLIDLRTRLSKLEIEIVRLQKNP